MRELTSIHVDTVVGGNLVTGWVPRNWPAIAVLEVFRGSSEPIGVNIPGPQSINIPRTQHFFTPVVSSPIPYWEC